MTKDVNMQHMTMTEYVSIAILTESTNREGIRGAIVNGVLKPTDVIRESFEWADLWMEERAKRKNNEA